MLGTARIFQRALCYHVMNRGINREEIFVDEHDLTRFSQLTAEYRDLCGAKVYHWCLTDLNEHLGFGETMKPGDREEYAGALAGTENDEWMRNQGKASALGSEAFKSALKLEDGRFRRRRGRPVKRVNNQIRP